MSLKKIFGAGLIVGLLSFAQSALAAPDYVGSDACSDCHQEATDAWKGSHHALAWTTPTAENIVGDFNNSEFTLNGITTRFTQDADQFFIETDGPDGEMTKYPVSGVIGIEPLQQYMVETEDGRNQSFDVSWDTVKKEWYHMYPDQGLTASDGLHWTGSYKTWNSRCAECHATDYQRNYDAQTKTYSSTSAEIGVGCESCHGPGAEHVEWAEDAAIGATSQPIDNKGLVVDYAAGNSETLIQQCASCHSRREPLLGGSPAPGTPFHDAYRLSTLRPVLYHPDGQIKDEVYVYGSFLQSKMYDKGVTCKDCHDVHSGETRAEGNALCTQCHSEAGNDRFSSLPLAEYDAPSHTFHEPGTDGAQCKSCHMIERTYMGVDGRRDHSFRIPRPDLTVETGAPNACNDCHSDRSPNWAARQIAKRFPNSTKRGPHFSQTFHAVQQGDTTKVEDLIDITMYEDLPGIVRASALDMLQPHSTPEIAARTAKFLTDPDPLLRVAAAPLQRGADPAKMLTRLLPLLRDETRAVRIAVGRELLGTPTPGISTEDAAALQAAIGEWQASLVTKFDFPETQLVMAGVGLRTRNFQGALASFQEAVRLDPQMVQAWTMIVRIQAATNQIDGARSALEAALKVNPGDPALLGLQRQLPSQ